MRTDINNRKKKRLRSRSAIEPVIGHMKSDYRMSRNFLLGFQGDQINALMAGCAFNLKKILRAFLFVEFLFSTVEVKVKKWLKWLKNSDFQALNIA